MRICVSHSNMMGGTTLVNDFVKQWPNYKIHNLLFREKLQEKLKNENINTSYRSLSKIGSRENQEFIRDSIIDEISQYSRDDNVIFDRGLWDNLVYSLYLCANGVEGCDGEWMKSQLPIFREAMKSYDIIFFLPLLEGYSVPVIPNGGPDYDRDVIFRSETDNIFKVLYKEYLDGKRTWLPSEDTPAIIEIFGTPEERIAMAGLYIDSTGNTYSDDDSLLINADLQGLKFMEEFDQANME